TGRTISSPGPAGPTRSTRTAGFALGRHGELVVNLRCGDDQQTLLAVAGNQNLAVFAAFEQRFEAVEAQITFLLFFAMTAETRGFQEGTNVLGVGDTFFGGCGREFAEIQLANVHLLIGGQD